MEAVVNQMPPPKPTDPTVPTSTSLVLTIDLKVELMSLEKVKCQNRKT